MSARLTLQTAMTRGASLGRFTSGAGAAVAATMLAATTPASAGAQLASPSPQCSVASPTQDACQKSVDLFNFMAPQLGAAIAGGNAVLGQGGTLGGLGHFSVGLRANVVRGAVPKLDNVNISTTGAQHTTFDVGGKFVPAPAAEVAIGLFKGIGLGMTNIGGVDLLVNAAYIPKVERDDFTVSPNGNGLKVGFGARVGILQESFVVPGVSISYLRRDLPTVDLTGRVDNDTIGVHNLTLKTEAWRLVASKQLFILGLAAGVGRDTYDASGRVFAVVPVLSIPQRSSATMSQKLTRTNFFGDVSLSLAMFKLVGEIGRTTGGDPVATFNSFRGHTAGEAYNYGSIGARIGF
jgi:hypothetical protein